MIKIVIVDDDDIFRNGLKLIIEQDKDIQVCGVASDGNMAYSLCESKKPDLVLMDMQMPCCDGGNATLKIKRDFPEIKVLVLTTFDDKATVNKALSSGADGYVLKGVDESKLSNAIIATDEYFDNDTDKSIFSRVIAFSSIDFISQEYIEKYGSTIDYKLTALNALRYATGLSEKTITFENKTIDATSELYVTSSSSVKVIRIIFIGILPLAVLAAAFAIFFIRRNK